MKFCYVCKNKVNTHSYHQFPTEPDSRKQWLKACRLKENDIFKYTQICSKHFAATCFAETLFGRARLIKGSIPTLHLPKSTIKSGIVYTSIPNERCTSAATNVEVTTCSMSHWNSTNVTRSTPNNADYIPSVSAPSVNTDTPRGNVSPLRVPITEPYTVARQTSLSALPSAPRKPRVKKNFNSPRSAKRHCDHIKEKFLRLRKDMKKIKRQNVALRKKVTSLQELVVHLKENNMLSENAELALLQGASDSMAAMVQRMLKGKTREKYSPNLRAFAITLHFYSPKAYRYVRNAFSKSLPHPSTIEKWYLTINAEPGFTQEAFDALKNKGDKSPIVNLTVDEMAIREHLHWNGKRFWGYVDLGMSSEDANFDNLQLAKNALVFMATAINGHWKVPVGYFLINGLNADERAHLVNKCLYLLHEVGVKCHSLTFDGAAVNISMCKKLGCNFGLGNNFKPWFLQPATNHKIFVFWDACHMIKLVRNAWGTIKSFEIDGHFIQWYYLELLHNKQQEEGLRLANKLSKRHFNWQNEKMNVRLAVQLFSKSVSDALIFCSQSMQQFKQCTETAKFVKIINDAFDILNSRNVWAKTQFKQKISDNNLHLLVDKVEEISKYISNLKLNGVPAVESSRKTGFLGLIISLKNSLELYKLLKEAYNLRYLLTYKLSQDHLEVFFSAIRSKGGHNNNPSAIQSQSAYRQMLVRHEINASGNCTNFADVHILHIGSHVKSKVYDMPMEFDDDFQIIGDHDYLATRYELNLFVVNVVEYISGFVVRKMFKVVHCQLCRSVLQAPAKRNNSLLFIKDEGKLFMHSNDIVHAAKKIEVLFRQYSINLKRYGPKMEQYIYVKICNEVLLTPTILAHIEDQDIFDNHRTEIIKLFLKWYIKIRLHFLSKNVSTPKENIRKKLTKLILFKNQ